MIDYSQFSPHTISTEKARLWNPSKTLGIINPDYDCLTCIGYAPSQGRRCRNPNRADNRALISRTPDEIAYLSPNSPAVMSRLRAIAGPALCVRYHQGQADTVVMQWQSKIQRLKPQAGKRKPTKSVQSSRLQESARDRQVEDLQDQLKEMKEAMARLREEIDSQRKQSQEYEGPEERAVKDRQEQERKQRRREETDRETKRKENERLEKERLERERLEKERLAEEKRKEEQKQRQEREKAAANERIRQRAQKLREKREREKREKEQKEREGWDELWAKYQERWAHFKTSASDIREGNFRDAIPWPVKSGSYSDVKDQNVKEFFQNAVPRDENMVKLMRKECLKWHPDRWLREARLGDDDKSMVEMICRVVTELLNGSAGRSSEFFH